MHATDKKLIAYAERVLMAQQSLQELLALLTPPCMPSEPYEFCRVIHVHCPRKARKHLKAAGASSCCMMIALASWWDHGGQADPAA